jgi:hypothetical protein
LQNGHDELNEENERDKTSWKGRKAVEKFGIVMAIYKKKREERERRK